MQGEMTGDRAGDEALVLEQLRGLLEGEPDTVARLANVSALLMRQAARTGAGTVPGTARLYPDRVGQGGLRNRRSRWADRAGRGRAAFSRAYRL